jgi:hypothetical protein
MVENTKETSLVAQNGRETPRAGTKLRLADWLGALTVRCDFGRMNYNVEPGLYAVGDPDADSVVLVSANYKLSFDALRKELDGLDAWIMVLDTKGVNVWCAAGKGTFGTDEIVRRIEEVRLAEIVNHKRLIVPQLGAPGVAAHLVRKRCGFSVTYGPVRAGDIIPFIEAGNKATKQMRQVRFSFYDRLILTPLELVLTGRSVVFAAALLFILSGLNPQGYSSRLAVENAGRLVFIVLAASLVGAFIGPLLLPWLPGRSFSFKGFTAGLLVAAGLSLVNLTGPRIETVAWVLMIPAAASYLTMNFTGASTYTSISGVRKEMRVAVPMQLIGAALGLALWIVARFV